MRKYTLRIHKDPVIFTILLEAFPITFIKMLSLLAASDCNQPEKSPLAQGFYAS